ncbi:conserved repeat domain-containing protein [Paenibacillus catalpae]|uniref:Conserved repeat domain-containing protein n=1 Tax=Paenibacillus catalpae TaxID=1045775 RepID=A0A1I1VJ97_9BACL|nr:DUF11 domain-containing protein [Paenibacillus catalpae]SFD82108.1 conserved repeat domain-containing protein [Paenibacillus catalpae]
MTPPKDFKLLNQTHVRFRSGAFESVAYSNTVQTPLVGPILTAHKTAAPLKLILNQTVTFNILISNTGNRSAEMRLVDTLPAGLSFIPNSVLLDGSPLPGVSPLNGIPLGSIQVGSSVQVIFQAIVIAIPASHLFRNEAELVYNFSTLDGRVVSDSVMSNQVTLEVVPFQLAVHASLSSPVTFLGDVIFYDLIIRNDGLLPMENVIVFLPLPEGFEFIPGSVVIDGVLVPWIDPAAGIYIGYLAPGAVVAVRVAIRLAQMPAETQIPFQANIEYTVNGTSYRTPANLLILSVTIPSLTVSLAVDHPRTTTGSKLTYTVTVTNDNSFAVDAYLSRLIPQGTTFVPDSLTIGGAPRKGNSLAAGISLGTLVAGSTTVVAYQVIVPPGYAGSADPPILNQVEATYTYRLTDGRVVKQNAMSNPVATEINAPVITVHAHAKPMYYEAERSVYFSISVQNTGNLAAEATLYRSDYPLGFYLLDPQLNDNQIPSFMLTEGVFLGLLAPGSTAIISYWIYVSDSEEIANESLTQVATRYTARYNYHYEDGYYNGESLSNELILPIEQNIE